MQHALTIEKDCRVCIEPLEHKLNMLTREYGCRDVEACLILPVLQADPLQLLLIVAIEGLGNDFVAQQIGLNAAGDLRRRPTGHSLQRSRIHVRLNSGNMIQRAVRRKPELPSMIQIDQLLLDGSAQ